MAKTDIHTYDYVSSILRYDENTGMFYWKKDMSTCVKKNSIAGCLHKTGYWVISINRIQHKAHRLAYLLFYKKKPPRQLDHINGIKTDNRIINLREADFSEQQINIKQRRINSLSGHRGVTWDVRTKKWKVSICIYKKRIHLGYFSSKEEAINKYKSVAKDAYKEFVV
jgi:hypothetical protein